MFVDNLDEAEWRKTCFRIGGRSFRGSGLSSARLVRCMAIWIYDKYAPRESLKPHVGIKWIICG